MQIKTTAVQIIFNTSRLDLDLEHGLWLLSDVIIINLYLNWLYAVLQDYCNQPIQIEQNYHK